MAHIALTIVIFVSLLSQVHSRPDFPSRIPNGNAHSRRGSGITCEQLGHVGCVSGAARNRFGLDFKSAGLKYTRSFCMKDSDGDGLTNGEELGDPCCSWKPGKRPSRSTMLSHPGEKKEDGAKFAPPCRQSAVPAKVGKCRSLKDRYTAACVCSAIVSGSIKPRGRTMLKMSCSRLLGSSRKAKGFRWSCRAFFASSSGRTLTSKIAGSTRIVGKCT